mmetsp:Transcript_27366/g.49256  ORF Transcript_27366/g.49256 Transcript_27366/m.49256 type:complete len:432 (-) Transcript_27366:838-2133(-)
MLKRLSFADENFEACPIAKEPGYREYILTSVSSPVFSELDNVRVSTESREQARRTFIEAAMKLQENLNEIEGEHNSMLQHLEAKHRESEEQLKYVHRMLVDDLHGLKSDVDAGRQLVLKEQERLNSLRVHSEAKLKQDLSRIQAKFVKEVDKLVEEQGAKFVNHEEMQQEALIVLDFERDLALTLIDLLYSSQGKIIYSESQEFSAEYKYIQSLTQDLQSTSFNLHKVYQIADARSVDQTDFCFVSLNLKDLQPFMTQRTASSRLYCFNSASECLRGLSPPCLLLICRGVSKEDNAALTKQDMARLTVDYITSLIRNSGASLSRTIVDDRISALISDTSAPVDMSKLRLLERKAYEKYVEHLKRVWGDLEAFDAVKQQEDTTNTLLDVVDKLRSQVDAERKKQQAILEDLRSGLKDFGLPAVQLGFEGKKP